LVSLHERIERHRRLAVRCPAWGTRVVAAMPAVIKGTPFGRDSPSQPDPRPPPEAYASSTRCWRPVRWCRR
jgi:hypothetical protein